MSTSPAGGPRRPILGVLGGMGPLATLDFLQKLVSSTPAKTDQDHLRLIVWFDPTIPDRTAATLSGNEREVEEGLIAGINRLVEAGADAVAIPCNSAHRWFDRMQAISTKPVLHIADQAVDSVRERVPAGGSVALLASAATVLTGFYQERLIDAGYRAVEPSSAVQQQVTEVICGVKAGELAKARAKFSEILRSVRQNADAMLLACTELPIVASGQLDDPAIIDANQALAEGCLRWAHAQCSRYR